MGEWRGVEWRGDRAKVRWTRCCLEIRARGKKHHVQFHSAPQDKIGVFLDQLSIEEVLGGMEG